MTLLSVTSTIFICKLLHLFKQIDVYFLCQLVVKYAVDATGVSAGTVAIATATADASADATVDTTAEYLLMPLLM